MLGKTKAWFGPNKVELTKDTVYVHPSSKQCNYNVDTSNLVTKDELEKVKGMIDVSARVIGSKKVYKSSAATSQSVAAVSGYDYIEIYIAHKPIGDSAHYSIATTTPVVIANGGSGMVSMYGNVNSIYYTFVEVNCTASSIDFEVVSFENDVNFACTVTFYKYDR